MRGAPLARFKSTPQFPNNPNHVIANRDKKEKEIVYVAVPVPMSVSVAKPIIKPIIKRADIGMLAAFLGVGVAYYLFLRDTPKPAIPPPSLQAGDMPKYVLVMPVETKARQLPSRAVLPLQSHHISADPLELPQFAEESEDNRKE